MRAALLLAVALGSAGALAEEPPPKLELDLTLSELNGVAVPLGWANSLLGGAGGGAQAAAKMKGLLDRLGPLLSRPAPKSTEEANRLVGSGKSLPGVRSGYQARVRATLVKDGDAFVVESGSVDFSLYTSSVIAVKDAAIIDKVSARGSARLQPKDVSVRFSAPAAEGAPPTWAMDLHVTHPFSPRGFSDWSVKDGKVYAMHLAYAGDVETITGQAVGQPFPKEVSTRRKTRSFGYRTTGQEVTRHTPRRSATWVDVAGTQHAVSYTLRWQAEVVAEFNATPSSPERGAKVELDASPSKGQQLEYAWTFEVPEDSCFTYDQGNPGATKEGKKTSVVLLCDTKVKLKVTDFKHQSDESEATVTVQPRRFQPIALTSTERYVPLGELRADLLSTLFGKNTCAVKETEDHQIHRTKSAPGFTRAEVKDPDGPFDGWWYVKSHSLTAPRLRQVNDELQVVKVPGGRGAAARKCKSFAGNSVYGLNAACNVLNGAVVYDVELARQATSHHEGLHAKLFDEALRRLEPQRVVEKMIGPSEDVLLQRTDCALGGADLVIHGWSNSEHEVAGRMLAQAAFNKSVALMLRTADSDQPALVTFEKIGDKENLSKSPDGRRKDQQTFEAGVRDFEPKARACGKLPVGGDPLQGRDR